jgi:hypothetical protein
MAKQKLQSDWFNVFMRVPIKRRFTPYSESIATLAGLKAENVRIISIEVKTAVT